MRVVVLGPPASGKGTQAVRIAERYRARHLSTGSLLRDEVARGTAVGRAVADGLRRGALVPDETVFETLLPHLARAREGWVLDGFPRTAAQAAALDEHVPEVGAVDAALYLDADADELVRRMSRRAHAEGRDDDTPEAMRRRLRDFHEHSGLVVSRYEERGLLLRIDARPSPDEVTSKIFAALDRL